MISQAFFGNIVIKIAKKAVKYNKNTE